MHKCRPSRDFSLFLSRFMASYHIFLIFRRMTEDINVVPEQVSPSDDVELTIRQAYQAESDLKFSCPTSWTIKEVKEHVKNCLNNHPVRL